MTPTKGALPIPQAKQATPLTLPAYMAQRKELQRQAAAHLNRHGVRVWTAGREA